MEKLSLNVSIESDGLWPFSPNAAMEYFSVDLGATSVSLCVIFFPIPSEEAVSLRQYGRITVIRITNNRVAGIVSLGFAVLLE